MLTMHIAMVNIIVWFKTILLETLNEYYEHVLEENIEHLEKFATFE